MLTEEILIRCIVLLYRENLLVDKDFEASINLVKTILNLESEMKIRNAMLLGNESEILEDLKALIIELLNNPESYTLNGLKEKLQYIFRTKPTEFNIVSSSLSARFTQEELKSEIINIRNSLNNFYKINRIKLLIKNANRDLSRNDLLTEVTIKEYVSSLISNLEAINVRKETADPAILDETNLGNNDELNVLVEKVRKQSSGECVLMTGWKELNETLQGGFRRREMWVINALQHNYKSGCLQSLFAQLCMHNTPKVSEDGKKPAIIYVSFEDDSSIYTQFLYMYLYHNNTGERADLNSVTPYQMGEYIKENLTRTGYHPIAIQVDPSRWTYLDLFNKILNYESAGYEIHICILDYLSKLPTTGCVGDGPTGTALKELFQKCRMFFTSKNIGLITAHQLNSRARELFRNGMADRSFTEHVSGNGYTEICSQLNQIVDGELTIAKIQEDKKWKLSFYLGKHRGMPVIADEKKGFCLTFQPKVPLRETLNDNNVKEDEFEDLL